MAERRSWLIFQIAEKLRRDAAYLRSISGSNMFLDSNDTFLQHTSLQLLLIPLKHIHTL